MKDRTTIPKISITRSVLVTLITGAFALGIFIGASRGIFSPLPPVKADGPAEGAEGTFRFIRGSLDVPKMPEKGMSNELQPFQYKVRELIQKKLDLNEADAVSVYFRDLNNGNWFGINEREQFSQQRLLRLPLMIAYFKWAEINPLVLRKAVPYNGSPAQGQEPDLPVTKLTAGKSYTVNDLIYRMITQNDPAAHELLIANLPAARLEKVFRDLDVEYDPRKPEDTISLRSYAAFYRVLFNASYLSEDMSEKALRYLTKTTFRDGMIAGVPPNITIASKHGERTITIPSDDEDRLLAQFHEFGIIYHSQRPFLLGIMARGDTMSELVTTSRDITRLVFEEVDHQSL